MAERAAFPFLVATDGSPPARAAVAAAAAFPWPRGARPRVVVARGGALAARWPGPIEVAVERGLRRAAAGAARALQRRWPDTEVAVVEPPPEEGILAEAKRFRARAIVMGVRGQGRLGRWVLGSVSRGVARHAPCPVLVVKGRRPLARRRVVLGLDGSANGRRAVQFLAALRPSAGNRITVVRAVEAVRPPAGGLLPGAIRAMIAAEVKRLEAERLQKARRDVDRARARLARAGWAVSTVVRTGIPLAELLRAVADTGADLLVIGARGVGGFERLLLGSVAEGVLARSPVSVLLVR
jgi:nucleotide-binding universal stress UspA family protein